MASCPTVFPSVPRISLLAAAALLALRLAAPAAPLPAQQPEAPPADSAAPATAAELRALADSLAGELVSAGRTGGLSVAILRGRDTLVMDGFGRADVELDVPTTAATVFRIGSVTKQFTAALIQKLAAAGTLSVEDTLSRWVDVPNAWRSPAAPVTLRHLLTHTAGVPSYTGVSDFWTESVKPLSHDQVLDFVREDSLEFTPGTDYAYSNTGYYLLGMVIEEATGRRYHAVLRDSLLGPLALEKTSYCWQAPIVEGRAEGYTRSDSVPGLGELDSPRLLNARQLSMAPPFSAGAMCSTVGDLVRWTRALHGGRVVGEARLAEMTEPAVLTSGDTTGYAFGLSLGEQGGHRRIAHGGGINGFSAALAHYPEGPGGDDDVTIAVLLNTDAASAGRVEEALARAALGIPATEIVDLSVPADLGGRLEGNYVIGGDLPADIRFRDGKLYAQAEGQREFRLLYQGTEETDEGPAAVFRAEFDPENVRVEFLLPEAAAAPSPAFILHQGGGTVRAGRAEAKGGSETEEGGSDAGEGGTS